MQDAMFIANSIGLRACALLLIASVSSAEERPKSRPGSATSQRCPDERGQRWLDSNPTTPLAIVRSAEITEAGRRCCEKWAQSGSRYFSITAYGQRAGEVEITGSDEYDATQCYELSRKVISGSAGVGPLVSANAHWSPPKNLAWQPNRDELARLQTLDATLRSLHVPPSDFACDAADALLPLKQRALFFLGPDPQDAERQARWVVLGGSMLVLARLGEDGAWVVRHSDARWTNRCSGRAYKPLAVFDMNGDGNPEVIYHRTDGMAWGDEILTPEDRGFDGGWRLVAKSVGGSTA